MKIINYRIRSFEVLKPVFGLKKPADESVVISGKEFPKSPILC